MQGQMQRGRGGRTFLRFLLSLPVQEDLGLTHEQREQLAIVLGEAGSRFDVRVQASDQLHPAEAREQRHALAKQILQEVVEQLGTFLDPDQVRRVQQVELQLRGPMAFADAAVLEALELTPTQRARFEDISERIRRDIQEVFVAKRGGYNAKFGRRVAAVRNHGMQEMLAVLTDAQRTTWEELMGPPLARTGPGPGGRGPGGLGWMPVGEDDPPMPSTEEPDRS